MITIDATASQPTRVAVVVDEAEYARRAADVDGLAAPLPILRRSDGTTGSLLSYPTVVDHDPRHWRGAVWCCASGLSAAAQVLARATGRPLHHGDLDEAVRASRTAPVTVLVEPAALSPERLATVPHDAQLGVLVGRDLAATTQLVARTVLHGPAVMAAMHDVSFDTFADQDPAPGWLTGVRLTPTGLRSALGAGATVLAGRGHARDCLMHLNGGGICGRQQERPLLGVQPSLGASWTEYPTACQQGPRCWRGDVKIGDHLRSAEIRAAFVVLDSCRTAVAGGARIRTDVSIPLSMLEGNALAVNCAVGTRGGAAHAGPLFRALVRRGASLGQALSEMNGAIFADPAAVGKLALFGDAGLAPVAVDLHPAETVTPIDGEGGVEVLASDAAVLVPGTGLLALDAGGPLVVPRATGSSSWVLTAVLGRSGGRIAQVPDRLDGRWSGRLRPWLDRLRGLAGLGLDVSTAELDTAHRMASSAVRARAEAADLTAARDADAAFTEAERKLAEIQYRMIDKEIRWASRTFYSFVDGWPEPWQSETDEETHKCPQCAGRSTIRHRVRPAGGAGPALRYEVCVRCGEVLSGLEAFPADVGIRSQGEARRGDPITVDVTIQAPPDRPLDVALGTAFAHEDRLHCRILDSRSLTLGPGERTTTTFVGASDADLTIPDVQPFKILLAADGAVRCLTRTVWIHV